MSNEILSVLQYMEKEKGIPRQDMISAITMAIKNAAQKGVHAGRQLKIEIDERTGALSAWALMNVVDSVGDPETEVHVEKARQIDSKYNVGDILEEPMDPSYLGRIAAQTARQAIMQKIRQFEKERIYEDFKDQVGDIITGTVRRRDRGDLIVDLGKAEAMLPARERIPGEDYSPGERIRCLLLNIENTMRGPELVLSRSHPRFVRRLFELEVTEIADKTVTIEGMAREPGYRTKLAVKSHDPKVDPVGACVGARGARVKTIVRELGGEKIDIIHWRENPKELLEEAMKPAVPKNIYVDERDHRVYFEVSEGDLPVAIGSKGRNAKLTSQLIGWKLDIRKEATEKVGFEQKVQRAVEGIHQIPNISEEDAQRLVSNGITSPEAFEGVTSADLQGLGFSEEGANAIMEKVEAYRSQQQQQ